MRSGEAAGRIAGGRRLRFGPRRRPALRESRIAPKRTL